MGQAHIYIVHSSDSWQSNLHNFSVCSSN